MTQQAAREVATHLGGEVKADGQHHAIHITRRDGRVVVVTDTDVILYADAVHAEDGRELLQIALR